MVAQNVPVTNAVFLVEEAEIASTTKIGIRYAQDKLMAVIELNQSRDEDMLFNTGIQYNITDAFILRSGYTGRNNAGTGLSAGFGLDMNSMAIDFSLSDYGLLGIASRISLSCSF